MNLLERIQSDWRYVMGFRRLVGATSDLTAESTLLLGDEMEQRLDEFADRTFVEFEGQRWTYGQLEERANKYANWALGQGLKSGECVALFMENQPDYIAFWIGMSKVGVQTALINSNLFGAGLTHCINVVSARAVTVRTDSVRPVRDTNSGLCCEVERTTTTCMPSRATRPSETGLSSVGTVSARTVSIDPPPVIIARNP